MLDGKAGGGNRNQREGKWGCNGLENRIERILLYCFRNKTSHQTFVFPPKTPVHQPMNSAILRCYIFPRRERREKNESGGGTFVKIEYFFFDFLRHHQQGD